MCNDEKLLLMSPIYTFILISIKLFLNFFRIILIPYKNHHYNFLTLYYSFSKIIKQLEYWLKETISACINTQKFNIKTPFNFLIYPLTTCFRQNMKTLPIFLLCCNPNNVNVRIWSLSHHLDNFEYWIKTHCVGLK